MRDRKLPEDGTASIQHLTQCLAETEWEDRFLSTHMWMNRRGVAVLGPWAVGPGLGHPETSREGNGKVLEGGVKNWGIGRREPGKGGGWEEYDWRSQNRDKSTVSERRRWRWLSRDAVRGFWGVAGDSQRCEPADIQGQDREDSKQKGRQQWETKPRRSSEVRDWWWFSSSGLSTWLQKLWRSHPWVLSREMSWSFQLTVKGVLPLSQPLVGMAVLDSATDSGVKL